MSTEPLSPSPGVMEKADYLATSYDPAKVPFGPYPGQLARHLHEAHFRRPGRLLDAGCGRGEFLAGFAALGYDVAGLDVSPAAPEFASGFDVRVANLERQSSPFAPGSFDYVFSKSVIEHLRDPDAFLARLFEALKPGGRAIVMTPSWAHTYWGPFYMDHTHVTPFTAPSLDQAMRLAGFGKVEAVHFYQLPSVWRMPSMAVFCKATAALGLPYRPFSKAPWPEGLNKFIRFSNEVMLLATGVKAAK